MDIEKVQKINSLALELMKQGFAADREEAVKQAETILSKKDYSSFKETFDSTKESSTSCNQKGEVLGPEKINEILEKNSAFIVKKMKEYQEQIEGLKGQVSALKSEVSQMKDRFDGMKRGIREIPVEPQRRLEPKEASSSSHPRSGNYNEKEVSIEKFFYSGSGSKK